MALRRYISGYEWDIRTLRSFIGVTTSQVYRSWARSVKQEVLTDVLSEGAKLHWIGARRDQSHHKVFLYFHGQSCSPCTVRIYRLSCALIPMLQEEAIPCLHAPSTSPSCRLSRNPCLMKLARLMSPYWNIVGLLSGQMLAHFDPINISAGSRVSFPDPAKTSQRSPDPSPPKGHPALKYPHRR